MMMPYTVVRRNRKIGLARILNCLCQHGTICSPVWLTTFPRVWRPKRFGIPESNNGYQLHYTASFGQIIILEWKEYYILSLIVVFKVVILNSYLWLHRFRLMQNTKLVTRGKIKNATAIVGNRKLEETVWTPSISSRFCSTVHTQHIVITRWLIILSFVCWIRATHIHYPPPTRGLMFLFSYSVLPMYFSLKCW